MTIHLRPTFLPGTTSPLTEEEIAQSIAGRRAILQRHHDHEAVRALGEMLDLQAVQHTAKALDPDCPNREQAIGAANAVAYVAQVLYMVVNQPEQEEEPS